MITLTNISKEYGSGAIKALDDINLKINKGEIYGIVGYSGAGKSTLIRLLNGLETPTEGEVHIGQLNLSKLNEKELRKQRKEIGMVFQHFNLLWSRTVKENISFSLEIAGVPKKERLQRVEELVQLVGLEGRENAYPSQLSGGQKQRVGIARALANHPQVLLCDEATSALDPQTTDSILQLLVDINQSLGLTIVLITHEMHVIKKICHKVAVMENGNVVEEGDVLKVFKDPIQPITKKFVKQISGGSESLAELQALYKKGFLLQLTFTGASVSQPILAVVIEKLKVDMNVLQANISYTQKGAFGTMIVHIDGTIEEVVETQQLLNDEQVKVEVHAC
ncbi:methionine ABC transporter ATP-binding protein [Bacillus carboniphilus]|uniref:Methionine ABC transporter ATP-binding protein n=1 Tax=Bacillus carboniphilus TaxID=86663 RepID=A0ABY9JPU6_9BACI|nr:methionine ABC transporter ATP-binding protein [Bacillus carboniphilus]WLR41337.1 methionine ABC transporter ATP-binding protein [Bacillus carboniphilus]